jgi:hypothetical protein
MKRRKHEQNFSFKYHGVTIERDGQTYQVIHETPLHTYAVPQLKPGIVGGGVEKFPR